MAKLFFLLDGDKVISRISEYNKMHKSRLTEKILAKVTRYHDLKKDIDTARLSARSIKYAAPTLVSPLSAYDPNALISLDAKVMVRNKMIWLIECLTFVHEKSAGLLMGSLLTALNSLSANRDINFELSGGATCPYFANKIHCGTEGVGKESDGSLAAGLIPLTRRRSQPIVFEVAFRNQSYLDLLVEGSCWVNEFTDTDICILLVINEQNYKTNVKSFDLIIFRRTLPLWSDEAIKPIPTCIGWDCFTSLQARDTDSSVIEQGLHVQIIARQTISRDSLQRGEMVVIELPTLGLNTYYYPIQLFSDPLVTIDLTRTLVRMFQVIDDLVEGCTYPYQ